MKQHKTHSLKGQICTAAEHLNSHLPSQNLMGLEGPALLDCLLNFFLISHYGTMVKVVLKHLHIAVMRDWAAAPCGEKGQTLAGALLDIHLETMRLYSIFFHKEINIKEFILTGTNRRENRYWWELLNPCKLSFCTAPLFYCLRKWKKVVRLCWCPFQLLIF